MNTDFLSAEMLMSLIQMAQMQMTMYKQFLKLTNGNVHEARIQTEIYLRSLHSGYPDSTGENENGKKGGLEG